MVVNPEQRVLGFLDSFIHHHLPIIGDIYIYTYVYIYIMNMHIHVCNHPEVDTGGFKETTNRFYLSDDFLDISIFYLLQNDHIIVFFSV